MAISLPRRGLGRYEPVSDINITPLVDVMLVLLIVFMITAPMLAVGMRVDLPKATSGTPLEPKEPIVITVTKQGNLFVGRDQVSRDSLVPLVRAKLGDERGRPIYLRGDRDVAYGEIVAVVDRLALNGLSKFALVSIGYDQADSRAPEPVGAPP
jgi:biopolymer transport protein TolR